MTSRAEPTRVLEFEAIPSCPRRLPHAVDGVVSIIVFPLVGMNVFLIRIRRHSPADPSNLGTPADPSRRPTAAWARTGALSHRLRLGLSLGWLRPAERACCPPPTRFPAPRCPPAGLIPSPAPALVEGPAPPPDIAPQQNPLGPPTTGSDVRPTGRCQRARGGQCRGRSRGWG